MRERGRGRRTQAGAAAEWTRNHCLAIPSKAASETLSGSVKGPKRVPLSFRQHPGIKAQREAPEVGLDGVGVL